MIKFCIGLFCTLIYFSSTNAQHTISITISDAISKDKLAFANVYLKKNKIGASTNLAGEAGIILPKTFSPIDTLICSYVGYRDTALVVNLAETKSYYFTLTTDRILLPEISVKGSAKNWSALKIVKKAIKEIDENYPSKVSSFKGFYRELVRETESAIQLNEAFFEQKYASYPQKRYTRKAWRSYSDTYASADYNPSERHPIFLRAQYLTYHTVNEDQCNIVAARASNDTGQSEAEIIAVNGPLDLLAADKVKYLADFLDPRLVKKYAYKRAGAANINGEPCYIINFKPKNIDKNQNQDLGKKIKKPIYSGTLYISIEDLAIVKYECQLSEGALYNTRYQKHIPTGIQIICDYKKNSNKWFLNSVKTVQKINSKTCEKINHNSSLTRELWVQKVSIENLNSFSGIKKDPFIHRRMGNLRYFITDYDQEFWQQPPTNYPAIPKKVVRDLEKTQSLSIQFKARFFQESLKEPIIKSVNDSLKTAFGFVQDDWLWIDRLPETDLEKITKKENKYFKNFFIPQRSEFGKAHLSATSRIISCPNDLPPKDNILYVGYADDNRYGISLKKDSTNTLFLDYDKWLCDDCRIYQYSLNKDSTILSYLKSSTKNDKAPALYLKKLKENQAPIKIAEVESYWWLSANLIVYSTQDKLSYRKNSIKVYDITREEILTVKKTENNTQELEYIYTSKDKRQLFFNVEEGLNSQVFMVDNTGEITPVYSKDKKQYASDMSEDSTAFYLLVRTAEMTSTIFKKDKKNIKTEQEWTTILQTGKNEMVDDFYVTSNFILTICLKNAKLEVGFYAKTDLENKKNILLPGNYFGIEIEKNHKFSKDTVVLLYDSPNSPTGKYVIDLNVPVLNLESLLCHNTFRSRKLPIYETSLTMVPSQDGENSIPLRISKLKNSTHPVKGIILRAYGAYGAYFPNRYDEFHTMLMDAGYWIAQAHVRGSRAMGWEWYLSGIGLDKKQTIADYLDCAEYLKNNKIGGTSNLIAYGQSAGGVVIGAAINQKPELFKAGIFHYPYLDILETMLDPDLPLTLTEYQEWGNPENEKDFTYINSYSPYQQIKKDSFPDMIFFAGAKDYQTPMTQVLKTVAKYRVNNLGDTNIILHVGNNGHPGTYSYNELSKEKIYEFLFLEKLFK